MLKNKENHIGVETIRWELNVSSVENAVEWQERASVFTRDKIGSILEESFLPYASNDQLLELDHLEICLNGTVSEANLEEEIRVALSKKLKEIESSLFYYGKKVLENKTTSNGNSILFQLEHYLKTGYSSLSGDTYSLQDPNPYFDVLKQMPNDALRKWIAEIMELPESGIRLTEYFSTEQLDSLFSILFSNNNFIEQTIRLINKLIEAAKIKLPKSINKFHQLRMYFYKNQFDETDYFIKWWQEVVAFGFVAENEKAMVLDLINGIELRKLTNTSRLFSIEETIIMSKITKLDSNVIDNSVERVSGASQKAIGIKTPGNQDFIQNAGAVLLYPYLKGIFKDNGWLNTQNEFLNSSFQLEASYLLQFIITGNPEVKEYELMLNKLLCGYPSDAPITRTWNPELASLDAANAILKDLIEKWPRLGNTSPEGLRNSFLMRPGKLKEEENNWILWVERRGWDILMDSLPYPISIIKLPWMVKPLFIQW